jgi:hypothetical protein
MDLDGAVRLAIIDGIIDGFSWKINTPAEIFGSELRYKYGDTSLNSARIAGKSLSIKFGRPPGFSPSDKASN